MCGNIYPMTRLGSMISSYQPLSLQQLGLSIRGSHLFTFVLIQQNLYIKTKHLGKIKKKNIAVKYIKWIYRRKLFFIFACVSIARTHCDQSYAAFNCSQKKMVILLFRKHKFLFFLFQISTTMSNGSEMNFAIFVKVRKM